MPQKPLDDFPNHDFIIFRGTTETKKKQDCHGYNLLRGNPSPMLQALHLFQKCGTIVVQKKWATKKPPIFNASTKKIRGLVW